MAIDKCELIGVEALLPWTHPELGPISPAVFMEYVEASKLLASITDFVLSVSTFEAINNIRKRPLRISINITPKDLEREDFPRKVISIVDKLPHDISLVLEVTERFLLNRNSRTAYAFNTLKSAGVKFAIDDFGTSNSNLELLHKFPFDFRQNRCPLYQ
jgi:EAL domain-containing protein (putative c-di-GMP-specific phosphodiesterase class I)